MGAWGTGVFSDDLACDIRDAYLDLLGEGLTAAEAKLRILRAFASSFQDQDESSVAWLALAAVQWKHGRLDDETREHALSVIDSGSDLAMWETGSPDYEERRKVLQTLREQLLSPQPAEKKVAKRERYSCEWKKGSVVAFRLLSGDLTLLRVINLHTDQGGTYPVCELLDWVGSEIPDKSILKKLPIKTSLGTFRPKAGYVTQLMLVGLDKTMLKRFESIDVTLKPAQKDRGATILHRKILDSFLKEAFGLE